MSTVKVTNIQHGSATNVAMVLDSAGTVKAYSTIGVGNTTPATSGAGITFPATASASSDANTLDDYEEGTFTASMGTSGGSITLNSSFNTLAYTKIGRVVVVTGRLQVSSVSSPTGNSTIQGFPFEFVAGTEDSLLTGSVTFIENATGDQNSFYIETLSGYTFAYLWKGNRVSTATSFSGDEIITVNLTYMI